MHWRLRPAVTPDKPPLPCGLSDPTGWHGLLASRVFRISPTYTTPAEPVTIGSLTYSRGSVTLPVKALAATVNGDAR